MSKTNPTKSKIKVGGYVTKANILCGDGRTILSDAFKGNDGQKVPLVWQHDHDGIENVLGHVLLESRGGHMYGHLSFNDSPRGLIAEEAVRHGDIKSLSIYANRLVEKSKQVLSGVIREVSLVLSGANPGAKIDYVSFAHGDVSIDSDDEAIIHSGDELEIESSEETSEKDIATEDTSLPKEQNKQEELKHMAGKTVQDIVDSMSEEQKNAMYYLVSQAIEGGDSAQHSEDGGDNFMQHNAFDRGNGSNGQIALSEDDFAAIVADARKNGSFKDAFLAHADATYGIQDIDILFPDARALTNTPDLIKRETAWVSTLVGGAKHNPFSRIKTITADLTPDKARALGYVKGTLKKEEVFALMTRSTGPTTMYKKQKIDRDDELDIVDFDVIAFMKSEMRIMLDEEIGRACLLGDGRPVEILGVANEDKINEGCIRPIYKDDDFYAHKVRLASTVTTEDIIEGIIRARKDYKGTGNPVMFTTVDVLTDMLLVKDTTKRRMYNTQAELENALRVSSIVEVEVMQGVSRQSDDAVPVTLDLLAILVKPSDYVIGADKGGEVNFFDDFDIDYNQKKFLMETRISGALVKPKTALIIEKIHTEG